VLFLDTDTEESASSDNLPFWIQLDPSETITDPLETSEEDSLVCNELETSTSRPASARSRRDPALACSIPPLAVTVPETSTMLSSANSRIGDLPEAARKPDDATSRTLRTSTEDEFKIKIPSKVALTESRNREELPSTTKVALRLIMNDASRPVVTTDDFPVTRTLPSTSKEDLPDIATELPVQKVLPLSDTEQFSNNPVLVKKLAT
jgi:hypothetical protein